MKPVKAIIWFVALLGLSLIMTLPATLVLSQVQLNKELKLGGIQGPWWSFRADWLSFRGITQEKVDVQFSPSCLFKIAVCFEIDNKQAHIKLKKSLFKNSFSIEDSHINMSFDQLSPLLSTLFVKPTGSLAFKVSSIRWEDNVLNELSANINWLNVGVQGENFNLGSIQAQITHQPQMLNISLSDQSDKLDLSGTVKISNSGLMNSNVQLTTLNAFPAPLKSIIQSVMIKRGKETFEYKSKINNRLMRNLKLKF